MGEPFSRSPSEYTRMIEERNESYRKQMESSKMVMTRNEKYDRIRALRDIVRNTSYSKSHRNEVLNELRPLEEEMDLFLTSD